MSAVHSNISVFVPHIGCPNMCSFCNQRHITGKVFAPRAVDVSVAVETAAASAKYDSKTTEIAFFGGSFTAINRNYMTELLKTASAYVENGTVCGIRISTRPDAIDCEVLDLLKEYHVTAIELGAQSLDNRVLAMNNRGHTAEDVARASSLIKEYGFELGLQMMTGLYCDSDEIALKTAYDIIEMQPDTVRIYPTIVLKDTDLAALYADGIYKPQTLEKAVELASRMLLMFEEAGIRVIRLGLHSIEKEAYIAGPWHPAFSELCQSKIYLERAMEKLEEKGNYTLFVNKSSVSKMTGQKRANLKKLEENGYNCKVKTDDKLGLYDVRAERGVD